MLTYTKMFVWKLYFSVNSQALDFTSPGKLFMKYFFELLGKISSLLEASKKSQWFCRKLLRTPPEVFRKISGTGTL